MIGGLLAGPAPAVALEELGSGDVMQDQLSVEGPDLFYARALAHREGLKGFDVMRAGAAGSLRVAHIGGPGKDRFFFGTDFDASASLYAVGLATVKDDGEDFIDDGGMYLAAPLGAKPKLVTECAGTEGANPTVAVDGDVMALQPSACEFAGDVNVIDTSPGAAVPKRTIPVRLQNSGELRLAGRYVAYVDEVDPSPSSPGRLVHVYDWVAGQEAYQAHASAEVPIAGRESIDWFDLQSDGTLVYPSARIDPPEPFNVKPPCSDSYGVGWASVAEPVGHLVPGVRACSPEIRIGAGRVAFFRGMGEIGSELVTAGLDGTAVTPVARFAHLRLVKAFDFDGDRAGFAVQSCLDPTVFAESAAPAVPAEFAQPDCPVTIAARTGRVSRRGVTSVRIGCPSGCRAVSLRVKRPFRYVANAANVAAGRTRSLTVKLPRKVLARLDAGRRVRLRVLATTEDPLDLIPAVKKNFTRWVSVRPR